MAAVMDEDGIRWNVATGQSRERSFVRSSRASQELGFIGYAARRQVSLITSHLNIVDVYSSRLIRAVLDLAVDSNGQQSEVTAAVAELTQVIGVVSAVRTDFSSI